MTRYYPLYSLEQQNLTELYLFWTLAALMIIIPAVVVYIWSKKGE